MNRTMITASKTVTAGAVGAVVANALELGLYRLSDIAVCRRGRAYRPADWIFPAAGVLAGSTIAYISARKLHGVGWAAPLLCVTFGLMLWIAIAFVFLSFEIGSCTFYDE